MKTPFLNGQWGVHFFYRLIIIGLTGVLYLKKSHELNSTISTVLSETMQRSEQMLRFECTAVLMDINKNADAYKNAFTQANRYRANEAFSTWERTDKKLKTWNIQAQQGNLIAYDSIIILLKNYADSLSCWSANDSNLQTKVYYNQHTALLNSNLKADLPLVLQTLQTQISINILTLLQYWQMKGHIEDDLICWGYEPFLNTENHAPLVGEEYEADLFMGVFDNDPERYKIIVNGDTLPMSDGIGHFSRQFDTPGKKYLDARIIALSPFSGDFKIYDERFIVNVLPPCR